MCVSVCVCVFPGGRAVKSQPSRIQSWLCVCVCLQVAELGVVAGGFGLGVGLLWPLIRPVVEISKLAGGLSLCEGGGVKSCEGGVDFV